MRLFRNNRHAARSAQALFYINAAIWFLRGILDLSDLGKTKPDHSLSGTTAANFMFGNAGAMILCAFFIGRHNKNFYFFAVALLFINILFIITDPLNVIDFITLMIDLILIGILIRIYQNYKY